MHLFIDFMCTTSRCKTHGRHAIFAFSFFLLLLFFFLNIHILRVSINPLVKQTAKCYPQLILMRFILVPNCAIRSNKFVYSVFLVKLMRIRVGQKHRKFLLLILAYWYILAISSTAYPCKRKLLKITLQKYL